MAPLFSKNVILGHAIRMGSRRKIALGTWNSGGDPSIYGTLEIPVENAERYIERLSKESGIRITLTHFVGRAIAETFKRHPDLNCLLRFGKLYPRKTVDVCFLVNSEGGKDLSGLKVKSSETKSVVEIAKEIDHKVKEIRNLGDPEFKKVKKTFSGIPGVLAKCILDFTSFLTYTLNFWSPLLGSPKDPFGSLILTNIGSLGLDSAYAPLVPYARVPLVLVLGEAKERAMVVNGQVVAKKMVSLCATIDHRLIDGAHAANMSKTIQAIFANPDKELG